MGYDEIILHLGTFGRHQRKTYFLLCFPIILCGCSILSSAFLHAKPNHRCRLPGESPNSTYNLSDEILNVSFPYDQATGKFSSCSKLIDGKEVACDTYIFDDSVLQSSIVVEWNVVCKQAYFTALLDSIFMVGALFGSIVIGHLSDRWGRRNVVFGSAMLHIFFGFLSAVVPTLWLYSIFRFVIGFMSYGSYLVAYVIVVEMVTPKNRLVVSVTMQTFLTVGYIIESFFAYFIDSWRFLQAVLMIPGVVCFSYWWFLPESIRWLISKGRLEEAKTLIAKVAQENKVEISEEIVNKLLSSDVETKHSAKNSISIFDVFKYPTIRKRSVAIFFNWAIISITYYGLLWNAGDLGGNAYLNIIISSLIELPAQIFSVISINRWGRKNNLFGCLSAVGISLISTSAVPKECTWAIITLAMIGKLAASACFNVIYIFSIEQFPTDIRNTALGFGSMCARIGAILSPLIILTNKIWKPFPLIIFGCLSVLGAIASLILPETRNRALPETIADMELMEKSVQCVTDEELRLNIIKSEK